ncbi:MAG: hypothetical protein HXS47_08875 [Theionarchaea archaeon]|nr:hypothetical protein [Theionarchaea archaeon]
MTQIDLKSLEKKAFTSYHEDGIIDIFAGAWMLIFGIFALYTDKPWVAGLFPVYGFPFFALAKKHITAPRIGFVEFSEQRRSFMLMIYIGIVVIFSCFGILFYTDSFPSWMHVFLHRYPIPSFGLIVGVLFLVCAWATRIIRFYLYALLIMAVTAIGQIFGPHIPYEYFPVALGLVILSGGILVLIRFIQIYPVEAESGHRGRGCT